VFLLAALVYFFHSCTVLFEPPGKEQLQSLLSARLYVLGGRGDYRTNLFFFSFFLCGCDASATWMNHQKLYFRDEKRCQFATTKNLRKSVGGNTIRICKHVGAAVGKAARRLVATAITQAANKRAYLLIII